MTQHVGISYMFAKIIIIQKTTFGLLLPVFWFMNYQLILKQGDLALKTFAQILRVIFILYNTT